MPKAAAGDQNKIQNLVVTIMFSSCGFLDLLFSGTHDNAPHVSHFLVHHCYVSIA